VLTATQGYYDGNVVIFDEKPAALSGRVIVTFLQDDVQAGENKKLSAFKRLCEMDFSLSENFDADKARAEAMREKYGTFS